MGALALRIIAHAMTVAMLVGSVGVIIWVARDFPGDPDWDE